MADWDAILRGGGQGATLGFGDEAAAKILASLPQQDDGTGIPREYAGGQYEQYRDEARADNAAAKERAPWQYGISNALGAAPLAIATSPLAGGATGAARVAAGGLQGGALGGVVGAGESNRTGQALARDAALGAGVGGALGTGAGAAIEGMNAGIQSARSLALRNLATEGAGAAVGGAGAAPAAELGGAQVVKAVPPRPGAGALDIHPEGGGLAEAEHFAERAAKGGGSPSLPPQGLDVSFPPTPRAPQMHGMSEAEADILEQRLRQTEAAGAKRIEARIADRNNPQTATVRPGRQGKAQAR